MLFMNIDQIPTGKRLYTLAVTDQPVGIPRDQVDYDEVDYVASSHLTAREVVRQADQAGALEGYEGQRVVGVINQSDGYVVVETWDGDLRA